MRGDGDLAQVADPAGGRDPDHQLDRDPARGQPQHAHKIGRQRPHLAHLLLAVEQRIGGDDGGNGAARPHHRVGRARIDQPLRQACGVGADAIKRQRAAPPQHMFDLPAAKDQHQHVEADVQPSGMHQRAAERRQPGRNRRHAGEEVRIADARRDEARHDRGVIHPVGEDEQQEGGETDRRQRVGGPARRQTHGVR